MRAVFKTLDEIDEALRGEYEEADGLFVLKIEGDHPSITKVVAEANEKVTAAQRDSKAKVDEFREHNVGLLKLIGADGFDDAKAKLEKLKAIDPQKYDEAMKKISDLEKRGVRGTEDVQTLVAQQVEAAVAPYRKQVDDMKAEKVAAARALAKEKVESALTSAAVKVGVAESAVEDFVSRGSKVFVFEEGKVVAKDGDTVLFSKRRPANPLDVEEWAEGLQETAPHIFKPSGGGGADGGDGGGDPPKVVNSFDPLEIGKNLEGVASGEVKVNQG